MENRSSVGEAGTVSGNGGRREEGSRNEWVLGKVELEKVGMEFLQLLQGFALPYKRIDGCFGNESTDHFISSERSFSWFSTNFLDLYINNKTQLHDIRNISTI